MKQRELLITGYLHQNTSKYFPKGLIKLFVDFYNLIKDWKFKGDALSKFFEYKPGEFITNPSIFSVQHIPFELVIAPNGYNNYNGYIILMIRIIAKKLPFHVRRCSIYLELFCFETDYKFKRLVLFDNTKDWTIQWYRFSMKSNQIQKIAKITKELNFGCFVEILNVKYQTKEHVFRLAKPVTMYREYQYKWRLTERQYNKLTFNVDFSLYSDNFNGGCMSILLVPFGWSYLKGTEGYLFTKVKLVKLPWNVKSIQIQTDFVIKCKNKSHEWNYVMDCNVHNPGNVDEKTKIKSNDFIGRDFLEIFAKVKILKIFDEQRNEVDVERWSRYGIECELDKDE